MSKRSQILDLCAKNKNFVRITFWDDREMEGRIDNDPNGYGYYPQYPYSIDLFHFCKTHVKRLEVKSRKGDLWHEYRKAEILK